MASNVPKNTCATHFSGGRQDRHLHNKKVKKSLFSVALSLSAVDIDNMRRCQPGASADARHQRREAKFKETILTWKRTAEINSSIQTSSSLEIPHTVPRLVQTGKPTLRC